MPYKNRDNANEASRRYYVTHKKEHKARTHKYYLEHREDFRRRELEWAKNNPDARKEIDRRWKRNNKEKIKIKVDEFKKKVRWEVIDLLGGKCSNPNCPIPYEKMDKRALQIDHINGGGNKERKNLRTYQLEKIILKRIKSGLEVKDYQLLCAYCNWVKRYEKRECCGGGRPEKI